MLQAVPPCPLARAQTQRGKISSSSIKRALTGLLIAGALAFSAVGADAVGGNSNGRDAFIGIIGGGCTGGPKGGGRYNACPFNNPDRLDAYPDRPGRLWRKWRIRRRSQPLRPRPNIRVTRGKVGDCRRTASPAGRNSGVDAPELRCFADKAIKRGASARGSPRCWFGTPRPSIQSRQFARWPCLSQ